MIFTSLTFLCIFLPLTLLLYFISPNRQIRNWLLILASLLFYAWGEPIYILLLLTSSLINYFSGIWIEKVQDSPKKKIILILTVIANLSLLFFFKYTGFFMDNLRLATGWAINTPKIHLPIGISFYTFKIISYVVDVYRGEVKAQKSPASFLLYVSLFHHLIAGPIVRYRDIAKEIEHRQESWEGMRLGVRRFTVGLAKKVLLSNLAGEIAGTFLDGNLSQVSVAGAWLGILLYAFQIYFDFSGYSDMAIGLGKMFGFTYPENFNYPYISKTLTEFWRRWHISLGAFFRDYVYIPLGGNRKNLVRNLFAVWLLTGLWHGASWNFILWGLFNLVFILVEKLLLKKYLSKIPGIFSRLYFSLLILVGWSFFYFTDTTRLFTFLGALFGSSGRSLIAPDVTILLQNNCFFIIVCILASTPILSVLAGKVKVRLRNRPKLILGIQKFAKPLVYGLVLIISLIFMVSQTYNPFLYFQF